MRWRYSSMSERWAIFVAGEVASSSRRRASDRSRARSTKLRASCFGLHCMTVSYQSEALDDVAPAAGGGHHGHYDSPQVGDDPRLVEALGRMNERVPEGAVVVSPVVELSIVIPTHDRPELLRRCIESVVRQTGLPERLELIVVVDG